MERTINLFCDCAFHKLEIEEFTLGEIEGTFLSIRTYEHKSRYTGKLLKKPKLLADVILSPEQTKLFKGAFQKE
jgi:hypothetical protein